MAFLVILIGALSFPHFMRSGRHFKYGNLAKLLALTKISDITNIKIINLPEQVKTQFVKITS